MPGKRNADESVTMPPNPTTKSWSAWFDSVFYHADRFHLHKDFIKAETERSESTASTSIQRLQEIYEDSTYLGTLQAHFALLEVKARTLMISLNYFQERVSCVTEAHGKLKMLYQYPQKNTNQSLRELDFSFKGNRVYSEAVKREAKKTLKTLFHKLTINSQSTLRKVHNQLQDL